jgi:hypothetical protein
MLESYDDDDDGQTTSSSSVSVFLLESCNRNRLGREFDQLVNNYGTQV